MTEQQQIDPEMEVTLTLPVGVVQSILNLLGKGAYDQVAGIVNLIQVQTAPQVQAALAEAGTESVVVEADEVEAA
jgi:hypothetical protein